MTYEQDAAHLLDELRQDTELDDELEFEALTRVRRLLLVRAIPTGQAWDDHPPVPRAPRPRPRPSFGPRAVLLMALVAGTALGAAGHAVVTFVAAPLAISSVASAKPRAPVAATLRAPLHSASVTSHAPPSSSREDPPARNHLPSKPAPVPAAPSLAASITHGFDAELRELEQARQAVATARSDEALKALRLHAQRHPTGVLTQEREALMVRALVDTGRFAEARAAAQQFLARYPKSTLRGSVERAIASIP